nr:MAG TPA: High potential iron-sulfur protein [Caudoviricetes sp.]
MNKHTCSNCQFYGVSDSFCKFKTKIPSQWEV